MTTEQKTTSRRKFIAAGAAAVAVAAVGGAAYYLSQGSAPPSNTASSAASSPLVFDHWHFQDAQVTEYLKSFEKEFNEPAVVEEPIDNGNYHTLLLAKFEAGEVMDMCYANGYAVPTFLSLGYLQDLESMTDINQIKSEMYPGVIDSESTADGKLYCLPYYWSARPIVVVNDDILNKAGLSGQRPETWDELWSLAAKVKASGASQYPVIPNWMSITSGITWDFLGEMANAYNDPDCTKTLFGKDFHPVFDTNTEIADLLKTWQRVVKDGIVDPVVFSQTGEGETVAAMNTGKYAFATTALYDFVPMNDPKSSMIPLGSANLVPMVKQPWGMMETGVYCWPKKNHSQERSQELLKFLGWKDPATGKRITATQWAKVANLGSGYPDTLDDPDVVASFKNWLGDRADATLKAQKDISNAVRTPWIWKSTYYTAWEATVLPILSSIASGTLSVNDGITKMRSIAESLWQKQYGSTTT